MMRTSPLVLTCALPLAMQIAHTTAGIARTTPQSNPRRVADSLVVGLTNNMPHAMTIAYGKDSASRKPVGNIAASSNMELVIRGLVEDSVTVWAISADFGHSFKKTFPVRGGAPAKFNF
jgi:hypothetical protein